MRAHLEAVRAPNFVGPLVHVALWDLDDRSTRLAHEVMVVDRRAQAVARFRGILAKHVDRTLALEQMQRPVNSRQTNLASPRAQPAVQLLCG
jgi:hypothetical protein